MFSFQNTDFSRCTYKPSAGTSYCYGVAPLFTSDVNCPITYSAHTCYCCYIYRNHKCDQFSFSLVHFSNLGSKGGKNMQAYLCKVILDYIKFV